MTKKHNALHLKCSKLNIIFLPTILHTLNWLEGGRHNDDELFYHMHVYYSLLWWQWIIHISHYFSIPTHENLKRVPKCSVDCYCFKLWGNSFSNPNYFFQAVARKAEKGIFLKRNLFCLQVSNGSKLPNKPRFLTCYQTTGWQWVQRTKKQMDGCINIKFCNMQSSQSKVKIYPDLNSGLVSHSRGHISGWGHKNG